MPAQPFTIGGLTFDPNAPIRSTEEREADWKEAEARSKARERGEGFPVLFLLDEFGTIGKLSAISTAFGLAAGTGGAGITMWAFVQDLNQLKRYYPDEWETFIGNVNALVCFGNMDQFTVEYVSKMLGTRTVRYSTTSTSTSESTKMVDQHPQLIEVLLADAPFQTEELSGHSTSENTTQQVVAQPLASPDEIRQMNRRKCIVIRHDAPAMCQRVDYFRDPTFSAWARPDPKYARR